MKHKCDKNSVRNLKVLYDHQDANDCCESLVIARCQKCGKLWKIRWQFDSAGVDNIWLRVGETDRGYSFTEEEARGALGLDIRKD